MDNVVFFGKTGIFYISTPFTLYKLCAWLVYLFYTTLAMLRDLCQCRIFIFTFLPAVLIFYR